MNDRPCPYCGHVRPLADDPDDIGATVGEPICKPCRDSLPLDS